MEKSKIIKIIITIAVIISAIIYYFSSNRETQDYENLLTDTRIVENKTEEKSETKEKPTMKVYVVGEVNQPGVIELEEGARIQDAIQGAGGTKPEADLKNINLAYEVSDGEKIYIPNVAEAGIEEIESVPQNSDSNSSSKGKVNINKATAEELTSVPGIGASTAQKIVTYREENGKFQAIEDIKKVSGIGDSKYESMKDFIAVK